MTPIDALRQIRVLIKDTEQTNDIELLRKLLLEMNVLVQQGLALAE